MLILGVDPGLDTTGYGLIEKKQSVLKFIDAGFIKTSSRHNLDIRLLKIFEEITKIFKKYAPDAVVLEKLYAHYKHPVTACLLGHARGAICIACSQSNIKLFEYGATRIKKALAGKGHAPKLQIKHMVLSILNLKNNNAIPLDVTDALSLAIAHSYILKNFYY